MFLFISGFGLVYKYERSTPTRVRALPFIGFHYAKLLRLMFLGYIGFAVVSYLHPHGYHGYTVGRVIAQLLMYINLMPDPDHIIKPGPYWYFGLMLQLYIVYRLVLYRRSSAVTLALIVLCTAVQAFFLRRSMREARFSTAYATTLLAACCPLVPAYSMPATAATCPCR